MNQMPDNLRYARSHAWVQIENDNLIRVGVTDFAQQQLGDLVFIELPVLGIKLEINDQCAVLESVKTVSELTSPLSGEVIAINDTLIDAPEQVNDAPYTTWLFCLRPNDINELNALYDAEAYRQFINE